MNTIIVNFINKFKSMHPIQIEECFRYGNCYYFALILSYRFKNATILYDEIDNHFIAQIGAELYDIRGNITNLYKKDELIKWEDMPTRDHLHYEHIVRDCINF